QHQAMRQEESNVLWWLYGAQSRDLEVPFVTLKSAASIVLGKELADLAGTLPGPYAARAFLDKAVREAGFSNEVTLSDSVNSCLQDWRSSVAQVPELKMVDDLCPVRFALEKAA